MLKDTEQKLLINERASLSRLSWTSESKTGMWNAYKHLHIARKDEPVVADYFVDTKGLLSG